MPVATLHEETSIDDLIGAMYPRLDPDGRKNVAAAVIKANPHLEGRARLAAGTVLTIPAVSGVVLQPEAGPWGLEDPAGEGTEWVVRAIEDYGEYLAQRHRLFQSKLKEQSVMVNDQSFQEALRDRPDAAQLVPEIEAAITARSREATVQRGELDDALPKLVEALGSF